MPTSTERMHCATCDYTSDPGSLLCALCGSPLRRTPADRRRTAAAVTAPAGPIPSGHLERSTPASVRQFTPPPRTPGPSHMPLLESMAEPRSPGRERREPRRDSWLLAGLGAAAVAIAFRMALLAVI